MRNTVDATKPKNSICLWLTESEVRLIEIEMRASLDNGAEDPDYEKVWNKATKAVIKLIQRKNQQTNQSIK